ncbi:hypothetical protein BaRGS_00016275 [Batillaria attramentaria]|uniref:Uncharacterized protein n=1 Tax=Batillaria attramentaria TaxID=370345 RepID=A0ABD0L060_9CAEN
MVPVDLTTGQIIMPHIVVRSFYYHQLTRTDSTSQKNDDENDDSDHNHTKQNAHCDPPYVVRDVCVGAFSVKQIDNLFAGS